ncbi:MAG: DUF2231 domain-containing protein [Minisyncoccia bacterium]
MTYNIHPIFVHFPIALLFIYSIIKILPLEKWFPTVSWKHIERALLVFGTLGAFAALTTGEVAEHLAKPNHQLVEMHSLFAGISTWVYTALLLGEILTILKEKFSFKFEKFVTLNKAINFIQKILTNEIIVLVLAIVGFVAITVTGLLGGVMVYGTSADPFAKIVLQILGIQF